MTQIVRAGESDVFHTRQQHTIKVAQVGRRLAEICRENSPDLASEAGIHPDVVEAACLAHDLGHPPFGHVGEYELDHLVSKTDPDGFEGNAQTFRVITKLSVRFSTCTGLDLTRATLAACMKYPWFRDIENNDRKKKWGAYKTEEEDFIFAQALAPEGDRTAEADLMDWADDIAYSVHDLEDFHRCGFLPWHRILDEESKEKLVSSAREAWHGAPPEATGRLRDAFSTLKEFLSVFNDFLIEPYVGSRVQRQQLRTMTSQLINRYIRAVSLTRNLVDTTRASVIINVSQDEHDEVRILKQITRNYIIRNPSLGAQQHGQRSIISELFNKIDSETRRLSAPPSYLPIRLSDLWDGSATPARFAADCISSCTENEITGLYLRLKGLSGGSVLDPIAR